MVQRIGVRVEQSGQTGRMQQNKRKPNEERWQVTPYDGGGGGGRIDSVDGFLGWVDTGIAWLYEGTKEPPIAPTTLAKPANA